VNISTLPFFWHVHDIGNLFTIERYEHEEAVALPRASQRHLHAMKPAISPMRRWCPPASSDEELVALDVELELLEIGGRGVGN
jgi:hypothetical protein